MGTTEQQTLDRAAVEDFAERYDAAWSSRDPGRLAELCTEDVVWCDPGLREPLHGRDGARRFAAGCFRMAPDFTVEPLDAPFISPTGSRVLFPYRIRGTMTGPWVFLDTAPTGRRFSVEGIDSWELRDGLLARYNTFYDAASMSRQIGVLPEHGSGAERVMNRVQHLRARLQRRSAR